MRGSARYGKTPCDILCGERYEAVRFTASRSRLPRALFCRVTPNFYLTPCRPCLPCLELCAVSRIEQITDPHLMSIYPFQDSYALPGLNVALGTYPARHIVAASKELDDLEDLSVHDLDRDMFVRRVRGLDGGCEEVFAEC